MPSPRRKPTIPLTKIPSVKVLCDQLGFQRATAKETSNFTDETHSWRKTYKTSDGKPGSELILWKEPDVQEGLSSMASDFINSGGNGEKYWSSRTSWHYESQLTYPEDVARIVELLKQLFWKQNKYSANNLNYGYRGELRDKSRASTVPSTEGTVKQEPGLEQIQAGNQTRSREEPSYTISLLSDDEVEIHDDDETSSRTQEQVSPILTQVGGKSPVQMPAQVHSDLEIPITRLAKAPSQLVINSKGSDTATANTPPQKRQKIVHSGQPKGQGQDSNIPRRTARKQRPVKRPGRVPDEVLDTLLDSELTRDGISVDKTVPTSQSMHVASATSAPSPLPVNPQALPKARTRVSVPIFIISRTPCYGYDLWNGHLSGKSFADFLQELRAMMHCAQPIASITLALKPASGGNAQPLTVRQVFCNEVDVENKWEWAKDAMMQKLKDVTKMGGTIGAADMGVWIEPIFQEIQEETFIEVEEDDHIYDM